VRSTLSRPKCGAGHRRSAKRRAGPFLDDLHDWLQATLGTVSKKSEPAIAMRYAMTRWTALTHYRNNGGIEIDKNATERGLRAVAIGRTNCFFAGSDAGGERAAA
jgi:transposase